MSRASSIADRFDQLLVALARACKDPYGNRLVTLAVFGSVGRGVARPDSDLDILVVADPLPRGRMARVAEFEEVEEKVLRVARELGAETYLSPVFKTPDEVRQGSLLFLDMTEDARLLIDEGGFFANRLEILRQRLRELGSRRIWLGNAWYWDLKPDFQPGDVIEL